MKTAKEKTVAVAIDFQEKLMRVMEDPKGLEKTVAAFMEGIKVLGIPVIVTQQYTKGLGETTEGIKEKMAGSMSVEKTSFSALKTREFEEKIKETGRDTVLLCGIETHICVMQTAMDLLEKGYKVFVIADCTASRKESDKNCGIRRMERAGAVITTYEAILFEILEDAKNEGFKEISRIIK